GAIAARALEPQPILANRLDVLGPDVDDRYVVPAARQQRRIDRAQGAYADDRDFHLRSSPEIRDHMERMDSLRRDAGGGCWNGRSVAISGAGAGTAPWNGVDLDASHRAQSRSRPLRV